MKVKNVGEFFSTLSDVREVATKIVVSIDGKDFILKDRHSGDSDISTTEIMYAIKQGQDVDLAVSF